jgi:hypothetical protein
MAAPTVLRESNIKVYASVLMDNSVSLDEKAVALTALFKIFDNGPYSNIDVYDEYGLGVYFHDAASGEVKTTHVPTIVPPVPA